MCITQSSSPHSTANQVLRQLSGSSSHNNSNSPSFTLSELLILIHLFTSLSLFYACAHTVQYSHTANQVLRQLSGSSSHNNFKFYVSWVEVVHTITSSSTSVEPNVEWVIYPNPSGGSRTEYLDGRKVGVVSVNESDQIFESKKYWC